MAEDRVDIIIPVFNELEVTKSCFESIRNNTDTPYRLIVVDNGSDKETGAFLEMYANGDSSVHLIRNASNAGWVKAVNQGIAASAANFICVMNNDTVVRTRSWLKMLLEVASMEEDIGLVNPCFKVKCEPCRGPYVEIDFCRGYCIFIKRAVINRIGGLDEAYGLGYYDDDDFSLRAIRAGFRCVRASGVVVEHLKDTTFSAIFKDDARRALHEKNKKLFYSKWGRRLRIALFLNRCYEPGSVRDLMLTLARRQHIVYLWNGCKRLGLPHINIREKRLSKLSGWLSALITIAVNNGKKEEKKFDMIFTDDAGLSGLLGVFRPDVVLTDMEASFGRITEMADKVSRKRYEV